MIWFSSFMSTFPTLWSLLVSCASVALMAISWLCWGRPQSVFVVVIPMKRARRACSSRPCRPLVGALVSAQGIQPGVI
jgi:hypothetical protein